MCLVKFENCKRVCVCEERYIITSVLLTSVQGTKAGQSQVQDLGKITNFEIIYNNGVYIC